MDIDLDFDLDRISEFLQSKLAECQSANAELQASLESRNNVLLNLNEKQSSNAVAVSLGPIWKKICNNKYVLGVEISNKTSLTLDNVSVIINLNASFPLIYKTYLVSSANHRFSQLKGSRTVPANSSMILAVTFDLLSFLEELFYNISFGVAFQQDNQKIALKVPSGVQLNVQDVTDKTILVNMNKAISHTSMEDIYACFFSVSKYDFVMVAKNNWNRLDESTLIIDCSLSGLNIGSRNKFFVAHGICSLFDGAVIELEETDLNQVIHCTLYCRDQVVLTHFFHHLQRSITNYMLIPKSYHNSLIDITNAAEIIRESVMQEISFLEGSSGNESDFISKWVNLQHETDILVAKVNQEIN